MANAASSRSGTVGMCRLLSGACTLVVLVLTIAPRPASAGCRRDSDCNYPRVCEAGSCVDPGTTHSSTPVEELKGKRAWAAVGIGLGFGFGVPFIAGGATAATLGSVRGIRILGWVLVGAGALEMILGFAEVGMYVTYTDRLHELQHDRQGSLLPPAVEEATALRLTATDLGSRQGSQPFALSWSQPF